MTRAFVSIGSNLDPQRNVRGALVALREHFTPLTVSTVYESEPVGFDGPNFYNLVVGFETANDLDSVLGVLAGIEQEFGRRRDGSDGSRTLDLDLLLFGELVRHGNGLNLPRPDIEDYAFVLKPLAELVPDMRHPETGKTFGEMWREFHGPQLLWPVELQGN
jgi:2-amino-4-hydroxy-6-hydroxymethyldihydropteridine diphosphokinase